MGCFRVHKLQLAADILNLLQHKESSPNTLIFSSEMFSLPDNRHCLNILIINHNNIALFDSTICLCSLEKKNQEKTRNLLSQKKKTSV